MTNSVSADEGFLHLLILPFAFIRSFVFAVLYLPGLILISTVAVICNVVFNIRAVDDFILEKWGRASCLIFGVRVNVTGLENIPKNQGCLFLFNHTSFFDVFAIQGYVKTGVRFGAKIELFKIPMFGTIMRRVGILPIDRGNRSAVLKVYESAKQKMASGDCYVLAPEGARNTEEKLGPFKTGPFILAIEAEAPIVPIIIKGAVNILPKGAFLPNANRWSTAIDLQILPPLSSQGYTVNQRLELQSKVRAEMLKYLPQ
ncbi:MAG: lysophospholipid acyltransferase family protein [Pseudobdellovibrionaceae bacterium]